MHMNSDATARMRQRQTRPRILGVRVGESLHMISSTVILLSDIVLLLT